MTKISEQNFELEVLKSDCLTLVDFGATWCGPCKKLHPIMQELAGEYGTVIKVVEVNVEESPEVAMKYGITSVPQLLFIKGGVVKETVMGLLPKSRIQDKIDHHLLT